MQENNLEPIAELPEQLEKRMTLSGEFLDKLAAMTNAQMQEWQAAGHGMEAIAEMTSSAIVNLGCFTAKGLTKDYVILCQNMATLMVKVALHNKAEELNAMTVVKH